jgi:hypothetical protein
MTFEQMQAEFVRSRRGALSLPLTGVLNYTAAAIASLFVSQGRANLILATCFWAIPPVAALIGRIRGEVFGGDPRNPLFKLSKLARLMVLATWAIHVPVWIEAPALLPLTMGIAFALHWVVFGWSIGHPLGLVHLALRATLVPVAWYAAPANRVGAVAAAVAGCYAFSVVQLRLVDWEALAERALSRGTPPSAVADPAGRGPPRPGPANRDPI